MRLNPIIERELKTRMRTWRTPFAIIIYIGIMLLICYIFLTTSGLLDRQAEAFIPANFVNMFAVLSAIQLGVIIADVPAFTAASVAAERERQTIDLLLCTRLRVTSIITGKLAASICFAMLLVVSSLPVLSLIFIFGGVTLGELLACVLFFVYTAVFAGSLGMFWSTCFKKSVVSVLFTYATLGFLMIGPVLALLVNYLMFYGYGSPPQDLIFFLIELFNPFVAFFDMLGLSPMIFGMSYSSMTGIFEYTWVIHIIACLGISILAIAGASARLNPLRGNRRAENRPAAAR